MCLFSTENFFVTCLLCFFLGGGFVLLKHKCSPSRIGLEQCKGCGWVRVDSPTCNKFIGCALNRVIGIWVGNWYVYGQVV